MRPAATLNASGYFYAKLLTRKLGPRHASISLRCYTLVLLMTLFTGGVALCQGPWTFTQIDSNAPSGSTYIVGNLNNSGAVVFVRFEPSGAEEVFLGDGTLNCLVANLNSGPGFNSLSSPTVERNNSSSSVAFHASLAAGGQGIYVGTCNGFPTLTTIVQVPVSVNDGAINDDGVVAFIETSATGTTIWKGDGTNSLEIDSTTSGFFGVPGINNDYFSSSTNLPNSGTVSYYEESSNVSQIELDSDLTKTILTQTCDSLSLRDVLPVINNSGLVAYDGWGIYFVSVCTQSTSSPETVIDSQGTGLPGDVRLGDLNIEGIVAFDRSEAGLTGVGTQLGVVVRTGDILPDGSVVNLAFVGGINDYCQISFLVYDQTGQQTVWRAEPTTCPVQPCAPPTCNASRAAQPNGAVPASLGIGRRLAYVTLDDFLASGWPSPQIDNRPLGTGGATFNKSESLHDTNSSPIGGAGKVGQGSSR